MLPRRLRKIVILGVLAILLEGEVWARPTPSPFPGRPRAPEIDAASGTSAIALLGGILLLVREKSRSRSRERKPSLAVDGGVTSQHKDGEN